MSQTLHVQISANFCTYMLPVAMVASDNAIRYTGVVFSHKGANGPESKIVSYISSITPGGGTKVKFAVTDFVFFKIKICNRKK